MIARLFRDMESDWRGRKPSSRTLLGELDGVVFGGESPQAVRNFPGVVSTEGLMGVPRDQESGVVVRQGDRIEIVTGNVVPLSLPSPLQVDGSWWAVVGPRQWDFPSTLTGWLPAYYWVPVQSTTAI